MELLERWAWGFALKHWADGASQDVLEHLGSLNQSQLLSNGQLSRVALDVCAEDERNGLVPRALQHVIYQLIDSAHERVSIASHVVSSWPAQQECDKKMAVYARVPCPDFDGEPNPPDLPWLARPSAHSQDASRSECNPFKHASLEPSPVHETAQLT